MPTPANVGASPAFWIFREDMENTLTKPSPNDGFSIVKEIFQLVARFQTPATPAVYEVWYQYVQKQNEPLVHALDYAINEGRPIDGPMLLALRNQFCSTLDDTSHRIQSSLASELVNLQAVVTDQKDAGTVYAGSLNIAKRTINQECQTKEELVACVTELSIATIKMSGQLETLMRRLEHADANIDSLKEKLALSQRGMMTDPMTGIGNRRYFDSMLRQTVQSRNERNGVCCLALFDMDKFKSINDTFGHDVGDRVIYHLANKIKTLLPQADAARLGGDEFAIFLRSDTQINVVDLIEEFRLAMSVNHMKLINTDQILDKASFSIGVSVLRVTDDEASWYQRADKLLYEAKRLGGNRVVAEKVIR